MAIRYPITSEVQNALERFPRIAERIRGKLPESGRSELEIVRLLGNAQYKHIEALLAFMDDHLPASGSVGKRVLEQTDLLPFHQALSEFDLLAHLQGVLGAEHAQPASAPPETRRGDIELTAGSSRMRVEVYCPADFFGCQLVGRYLGMTFKYLEVDTGFEITLCLESLRQDEEKEDDDDLFFDDAMRENLVRAWLAALREEAAAWIPRAQAGEERLFQDATASLRLRVKIDALHPDPAYRIVTQHTSMRSAEAKMFFDDFGTPQSTARSQWGRKLLGALQKRQCGASSPDYLRLLVVDFSLADTGWPEFICWPDPAKRLASTLKLLVAEAGSPRPYEAVLPAQLGLECGFGKPIMLNHWRAQEIKRSIKTAGLDRPCQPQIAADQPQRRNGWLRFATSRRQPLLSNTPIRNGLDLREDPDFQDLIESIAALQA